MEPIADRYRRLAEAFARKVAAVPADAWESPSPCEDWTARDVVRHVAETPAMFFGFVGRTFEPVPSVDDDPLAAIRQSTGQVHAGLLDPAVADLEFEGFMGRQTFAQAVDRFLSFDLMVHGWDLARATGQDETMDPGDVAILAEASKQFDESAMRGPGAFGPAVEPPAGADEQARVLAFLGRQP